MEEGRGSIFDILIWPRAPPREHHVEGDTQTPDIKGHCNRHTSIVHLRWPKEEGASIERRFVVVAVAVQDLHSAKISQFDSSTCVDEQIGRFDISMNNGWIVLMKEVEPGQDVVSLPDYLE